jgi:hypothetical protein
VAWCDFWQRFRISSLLTSARGFVRSPAMMQSSCPEFSLVTRAGCTFMTSKQNNSDKSNIKGIVHKEFILSGRTVNSAYNCIVRLRTKGHGVVFCYCDVLLQLFEHVWRLLSELWRQKNWLLLHDNAPVTPGNFLPKNNMTIVSTLLLAWLGRPWLFCFPVWRYAMLTQLRC